MKRPKSKNTEFDETIKKIQLELLAINKREAALLKMRRSADFNMEDLEKIMREKALKLKEYYGVREAIRKLELSREDLKNDTKIEQEGGQIIESEINRLKLL